MTKAAILIDGGYFLKRLPAVRKDIDATDPGAVARSVNQLIRGHLSQLNDVHKVDNYYQLLYRVFYYDARPYAEKAHTPITKKAFDYAKSREAIFRTTLFSELRRTPNLALRLGQVNKDSDRSWILKSESQKRLLNASLSVKRSGRRRLQSCFETEGSRYAYRARYSVHHAETSSGRDHSRGG